MLNNVTEGLLCLLNSAGDQLTTFWSPALKGHKFLNTGPHNPVQNALDSAFHWLSNAF